MTASDTSGSINQVITGNGEEMAAVSHLFLRKIFGGDGACMNHIALCFSYLSHENVKKFFIAG